MSNRDHQLDAGNLGRTGCVNVASVPQRSPFRYPGGKTWLVPVVRRWLGSLPERPARFVEPFAGGAGIGLTVAFEDLAGHVVLVELDENVAAVWRTILNGKARELAKRIADFAMSPASVRAALTTPAACLLDRAFQTILKNRVQHGGIMANGAGLMNQGENGKGIASRWYPATLQRRILDIDAIRKRISFLHADGIEYVRSVQADSGAAYFIDPPYTVAGRRLYRHNVIDHDALFALVKSLGAEFLMTYDDSPEVRQWADKYTFDVEPVLMKSRQHAVKSELLIGRNLAWARACQ